MIKKEIFTFRGVNQDITKSKHSKEFYYEGNNIRISATDSQSTGAISNEKGTELTLTVPTPSVDITKTTINYGNKSLVFKGKTDTTTPELETLYTGKTSGTQIIIGHTIARDNIILFSTDNNGFDCVWEVTETNDKYDITLLYLRNFNFSTADPIQAIYNFENDNIQKIYWVDGKSQLRFINTKHSIENGYPENLIDLPSNTINIVGTFKITQPKITEVISGGQHTAGMIQYAYNLYRLNSSQTKLSPLSTLIPLNKGKGLGGGEVNEIVGTTPVVSIENIDPEYTHIKVYAIKYTSYNQIPTISLIDDREIGSRKSITLFDDGSVIQDMSLSEFLFLGSDPIIPKHIVAKDNILFSANVKESNFDVDLDTRAYSFNNAGIANVYDNIQSANQFKEVKTSINPSTYVLGKKHDAINLDFDTNKYQSDGVTRGGEGKYIKYEIIQDTNVTNPDDKKFFKDNEVYRLGVEFYNRLGQKSLPKWIADFKAPEGNLEGKYNTLKVTLKSDFYVWLNTSSNFESEDDKPVGYKVLRANRLLNDKTIISQGFLNSMVSNYKNREYKTDAKYGHGTKNAIDNVKKGDKVPSLQRVFGKHHYQMNGMKDFLTLGAFADNDDQREVHKASASKNWFAESFQFNTMMQLFSPEVMFENISTYEGLQLRVKGALQHNSSKFWGQERITATKLIIREGKVLNGLTPHDNVLNPNTQEVNIEGDVNDICDKGIFGPANPKEEDRMDFLQFYRDFTKGYIPATTDVIEEVYGKPELTERGQGRTNYNNDPVYNYYNSLQAMAVDGGDGKKETSPAITAINSWGAKCLTIVLGPDDKELPITARPKLEKLWERSGVGDSNVMLVAELVKTREQIYLGGIYGGNTYEDKKRTDYIQIGTYMPISTDSIIIDSPGDTFVQKFRFAKIAKTDTEVHAASSIQITEIVEGIIETSVDLKNRHDQSLTSWDARFQPRDEEYHQYNRVYSQQPTLVKNNDVDFNFRKIKNFDTRIMASKIKVPGEFIDNWTDMLVNETQDLNGKHGPINSLVSFRDQLYSLQDNAIAFVSVNPRVQVQGSDGIAVELGAGNILHDYKYVTTNSGTLNKWGVVPTQYGIYYLDTENKTFNRFSDKIEKLSDMLGLHTWFQNNLEYDKLKIDNPILGQGATLGYDLVNNSVLLTLHQNKSYTRVFSEASNTFIGLMDYKPSMYISNNAKLYSLGTANTDIHEHFKGEYNKFYGTYYPSYVTLLVNPAANFECVFDNIEYNSELYLDDIDQSDKTLTHIHGWNEYQDTGRIPLTLGRNSNLRRKFRTWRANIPRDGRNRLRNPWIYLKLELDNTNNYKLILHDIVVHYTVT